MTTSKRRKPRISWAAPFTLPFSRTSAERETSSERACRAEWIAISSPATATAHGHRPGRLRFSSPGYLREVPVLVPGRGGARGLDSRNQLTDVKKDLINNAIKLIIGQEENNRIKNAVGEEKTKLVAQQKDAVSALAAAVNKAMMPDDAIEDVHRFSVQLNVRPQHITSWGYFEDAGFAVNIKKQDDYTDRWGHHHKTVAQGGVVPNDPVKDRTQAVSFLPGVTEMVGDVNFERIKRKAFSMGVMEGSFHVDDANVGIEKSLPYRLAQGLVDRAPRSSSRPILRWERRKPTSRSSRTGFASSAAIIPPTACLRSVCLHSECRATSAMTTTTRPVPSSWTSTTRGSRNATATRSCADPRAKHSMVFGFTTNLEPVLNRRLRLDDLESADRNKDLPFSEFFSDKIAEKVPAHSDSRGALTTGPRTRRWSASGCISNSPW